MYNKEKAQHRRLFVSIFCLKKETFPVSEILCVLSPGKRDNIAKNLAGLQNFTRSSGATYFCLLTDLNAGWFLKRVRSKDIATSG
jgi:hypothetical protein